MSRLTNHIGHLLKDGALGAGIFVGLTMPSVQAQEKTPALTKPDTTPAKESSVVNNRSQEINGLYTRALEVFKPENVPQPLKKKIETVGAMIDKASYFQPSFDYYQKLYWKEIPPPPVPGRPVKFWSEKEKRPHHQLATKILSAAGITVSAEIPTFQARVEIGKKNQELRESIRLLDAPVRKEIEAWAAGGLAKIAYYSHTEFPLPEKILGNFSKTRRRAQLMGGRFPILA